jgi:hypothetical protein
MHFKHTNTKNIIGLVYKNIPRFKQNHSYHNQFSI